MPLFPLPIGLLPSSQLQSSSNRTPPIPPTSASSPSPASRFAISQASAAAITITTTVATTTFSLHLPRAFLSRSLSAAVSVPLSPPQQLLCEACLLPDVSRGPFLLLLKQLFTTKRAELPSPRSIHGSEPFSYSVQLSTLFPRYSSRQVAEGDR